jgi:hypothetical protein
MLLLVACRQDDCTQTEGTAQLRFQMKAAGSSLQTRGVEDLNDDGTVSEAEAIVDGRKMYRLSVFLLDGNTVISSTVLEANDQRFTNNDHTEATVSFDNLDYTKTYKLYAVANYGDYNGLTGALSEVTAGNMTVSASNAKLCNKNTPYPLTLAKDISLSPGVNNIGGELVRTYARIRINVRNQSATNNLTITKLSFPTKFTQSSVDIFNEGGTANAQPVVTSLDAITPFEANTEIPMLNDKSNVSEKTIFDSYLLESTGGDYRYTLGVKYGGGNDRVGEEIGRINGIKNSGLYIMRSNGGLYLHDNGTTNFVGVGQSPFDANGKLNRDYVWQLTKLNNNNSYTVQSLRGRYMQSSKVNGDGIPLVTNRGNNDYFNVQNFTWGDEGVNFVTTNGNYWLSTADGKACGHTRSTREFFLYEVSASTITSETTIPISIIDKNTGEASPLTAIKRNDFINIWVNVTYNEKTGEVQFEVANWDEVNGEVEFD